jgi:ABC-type glutathione transport system ATPase component
MNAGAGMTNALGRAAADYPRPGSETGGGGLVVELAGVTKVYPGTPPVTALREVSFAVAAGELVAIAGTSGSGKSTLLHLIGTLDRPSSGIVRVAGLAVAALGDRQLAGLRAQRIGFVFQQYFLAEHQTVADNVADGLLYVANIISVLERRSKIGLRRALGATKNHIRAQFLAEAILLALAGGAAGVAAAAAATAVYAHAKSWATVIPPVAWAGGLGATIVIGAAAGLLPALCRPPLTYPSTLVVMNRHGQTR